MASVTTRPGLEVSGAVSANMAHLATHGAEVVQVDDGGGRGDRWGYRSVGEPGVRETAMDMGSPMSVAGGVEGRRENWRSVVSVRIGSGTRETSMGKGEEGRTVSEAVV